MKRNVYICTDGEGNFGRSMAFCPSNLLPGSNSAIVDNIITALKKANLLANTGTVTKSDVLVN